MSRVRWSETTDKTEWDGFAAQNGGSIFQSWRWRKVLESLGSRPLYLTCRDGKGTLLAICPFFYQKAGRRLLYLESLPLSHMAGPIIGRQAGNVQEIMESLRQTVRFSIANPVVSLKV